MCKNGPPRASTQHHASGSLRFFKGGLHTVNAFYAASSISNEATAGSRQPRLRSRESVLVFDHCAWHRQLCVRPAPLAKLSVSFFLPAPLVPRHVEVSPSCASPPGCRDCTWNDWDLEVGLFPDVLLFCLMLFLSSPLLRGYDVTELGCSLAAMSSKVPSWW